MIWISVSSCILKHVLISVYWPLVIGYLLCQMICLLWYFSAAFDKVISMNPYIINSSLKHYREFTCHGCCWPLLFFGVLWQWMHWLKIKSWHKTVLWLCCCEASSHACLQWRRVGGDQGTVVPGPQVKNSQGGANISN